ncbi:hypothetical protein ACP275_08G071300 [Erythranthe tilingii]
MSDVEEESSGYLCPEELLQKLREEEEEEAVHERMKHRWILRFGPCHDFDAESYSDDDQEVYPFVEEPAVTFAFGNHKYGAKMVHDLETEMYYNILTNSWRTIGGRIRKTSKDDPCVFCPEFKDPVVGDDEFLSFLKDL